MAFVVTPLAIPLSPSSLILLLSLLPFSLFLCLKTHQSFSCIFLHLTKAIMSRVNY